MDQAMNAIKQFAEATDASGRKELIDALRDVSYSLETPDDTLQRIMYLPLQTAAVRTGIDLKIFDLLASASGSMSLEQLQKETRAAPLLLGRLLRYLSSVGMIKEVGVDSFSSNNVTKALAIPGNQAGVHHLFDTVGPQFHALPDFLLKNNFQDVTDNTNTAHQVAHNSPLPAFLWFMEHPEAAAYFNNYMAHRRKDQAICWDVYPVEQAYKGLDPQRAVLVDIGGNMGHQCIEFKNKFPNVPGRVILQDLPGPISMAFQTPGVENQIHDMFKPEPIKGAKFYYLRAVLHDWPDDKCRDILNNIIQVMGPDSVILIDEMVLPDRNVHWHATQIDLTMMAALAAVERTQTQWAELLDSVGLKVENSYVYTPSIYETIMAITQK